MKIELDSEEVMSDMIVVVDEINKYFTSIQSGLDTDNRSSVNGIPCLAIGNSFFIIPASENEILNIIKSLKNKKSSGFDNFNSYLITNIADLISPVLTHIINLSFSSGVFPDILKRSIVVPIYKKGVSCKLDNLRPISLLSIFSKIIETVMKDRITKYLNSLHFLSSKQYGFRKGKSTEDALIIVSEYIFKCLNEDKKTTGLFVDFRKAFDLVNHSVLLQKLESIGVRGLAQGWFKSFLTGRTQQVRIEKILSTPQEVTSGVPQGSVLSATLYLIFINDLLESNFNGTPNAFADDIAFFTRTITYYI